MREILNRLTVENLVTAEGQRGFEVAPVSQDGLRDIADLRILLETHAIRRSLAEGDLDWRGNVVSAHYKLSQVEKNLIGGDASMVEQWVRQDWGFHHAVISACESPAVTEVHSSVFDRFQRYHILVLDFRGKPAADEHQQLRDLVWSGTPTVQSSCWNGMCAAAWNTSCRPAAFPERLRQDKPIAALAGLSLWSLMMLG
ncbi:GntR family transcriptional regulator [Loktanella sp. DJP18]|uniref:GntR family transcriptional regulator n=1 Tax=Loktanella sp. DJP18 TaxID=3409788 RepID=UPI003BB49A2B